MSVETDMMIVLGHVADEARRQREKWGEQNHPNGTGSDWRGEDPGGLNFKLLADWFRECCDQAAQEGTLTWRHILLEETFEALAEEEPTKLRVELIQTAAVNASWIEAIDRRAASAAAGAQS